MLLVRIDICSTSNVLNRIYDFEILKTTQLAVPTADPKFLMTDLTELSLLLIRTE